MRWREIYNHLVEENEEKGLIGRPRSRWENNIKIYIKEIRYRILTGFSWLRIGSVTGFQVYFYYLKYCVFPRNGLQSMLVSVMLQRALLHVQLTV
jgi:hypothetical protein